jgi:hypothetical protein
MKFPIWPDGPPLVVVTCKTCVFIYSFRFSQPPPDLTGRHNVVPVEGVVCCQKKMTTPLIASALLLFIFHRPKNLTIPIHCPASKCRPFSYSKFKTANHLLMAIQLSFSILCVSNLLDESLSDK